MPASKTLDHWLVVLLIHVQSALRRLREMAIKTVTPSPSDAPTPPTMAGECAFCAGELQGVVTEIEDLFEVLEALNRYRPSLVSAAMSSDSDAYFSLSTMLQVDCPATPLPPLGRLLSQPL